MNGSTIVPMMSRPAYCAAMLDRLSGVHQGFHTVQVTYGLANAVRVLSGSVVAEVLLEMFVIFMKASGEGFIACVDEVRPTNEGAAFDLVLAPFAPFHNTGVPEDTPIQRLGVSVLFGIKHRALVYRPRERQGDIGYISPQQLPSFA